MALDMDQFTLKAQALLTVKQERADEVLAWLQQAYPEHQVALFESDTRIHIVLIHPPFE